MDRLGKFVVIKGAWECDVVEVIEPRAVKASNDIHHVAENHSFVEGPLFGRKSMGLDFRPLPGFGLIGENIVESLLLSVDASEDEDRVLVDHC